MNWFIDQPLGTASKDFYKGLFPVRAKGVEFLCSEQPAKGLTTGTRIFKNGLPSILTVRRDKNEKSGIRVVARGIDTYIRHDDTVYVAYYKRVPGGVQAGL